MKSRVLRVENWRELMSFFGRTYQEWQYDHPDLLAAGLGYFALFSVAPLIVIGTAVVGQVWSTPDLQSAILERLAQVIGSDAAGSLDEWLYLATGPGKAKATLFSSIVLYLAASRIFSQLRAALNVIWDVPPRAVPWMRSVLLTLAKNIGMMIGLALFVFLFFIADALFGVGTSFISRVFPVVGALPLLQVANGVLSFSLFSVLFAAAYKYVPNTPIAWRDVWPGAIFTSAVFTIGKVAIGLYFQLQTFSSVYGAASSVIVFLMWIYFAAQLFFFGAEFTWMYAREYGSRRPDPVPVTSQ